MYEIIFNGGFGSVGILISDYEQTIGNTKTDLSLDIQELKNVGYVLNRDSMRFYGDKIESLKSTLCKVLKVDSVKTKDMESIVDSMRKHYSDLNDKNLDYASLDSFIIWNRRSSFLMRNSIYYNKFSFKRDSVYVNKWLCTYSIKNPLLNNAKQTITKTYFIYSDESGILRAE